MSENNEASNYVANINAICSKMHNMLRREKFLIKSRYGYEKKNSHSNRLRLTPMQTRSMTYIYTPLIMFQVIVYSSDSETYLFDIFKDIF